MCLPTRAPPRGSFPQDSVSLVHVACVVPRWELVSGLPLVCLQVPAPLLWEARNTLFFEWVSRPPSHAV